MSASGPEFPAFISLKTKRDAGTEAEFLAAVDSILGNAKRKITDFSREAQDTLDSALSVKRNQAGSLDLGVTEMRAAAEAQNARAVAAREVANALNLTIKEEKSYTQEMRNQVAAARLLAESEERESAVLRTRIAVLDQVQERLNKQASATDMVVAAQRRGTDASGAVTNSVRSQRYAFIQANQQLQDMAIQFQSGTRGSVIFAEQVPQLGFALSGISKDATGVLGVLGRFGTFMTSGWGTALAIGVVALSPLIDALFKTADAAENAWDKMAKQRKETAASDAATQAYNKTLEGQIELINKLNDSLDKAGKSQHQAMLDTLADAQAKQGQMIVMAGLLNFNLADAKTKADTANRKFDTTDLSDPTAGADALGEKVRANALVSSLQAQLSAANAAIASSGLAINKAMIPIAEENAKALADPLEAINQTYARQAEAAKAAAAGNRELAYSLDVTLAKIEKNRAADEAKYRKAHQSGGSGQYGREINSTQARSIAESAGFRVTDGDRTLAQQKWDYDHLRKPGNPVAFPNANAPHVRGNALDIAFGAGVTEASLKKAYADQGVRLTKILKESGHFHIEWSTSGAGKANHEAEALAKHAQEARDAVAGIAARWDDQPRIVDEVARSVAKLNEIIADPKVPASVKAVAEATKASAQSFIDRGVGKWIEDGNHQLQVQKLVQAGYEDEAAVLDTLYRKKKEGVDLTEQQAKRITDQVLKEQEVNRELERRQRLQSAYLDASRSIRGELESLFAGNGANFGQVFKQLQSKVFVEQVFGKMFEDMDKYIKHNTGLDDATAKLVSNSTSAGTALENLANVVNGVSGRISGSGTAVGAGADFNASFDATFNKSSQWDGLFAKLKAANDNPEIVVKGVKPNSQSIIGLNPVEFFAQMGAGIGKNFTAHLDTLFGGNFFGRMSGAVEGGFQGFAMSGSPIGAALGALAGVPGLGGETGLFGKAFSGFAGGSQIGMLAQMFGGGKGSMEGAQIGGALSSFIPGLGPMGSILGAVVGGGKLSATKVGGSLAGAGIGMAIGGPVGALIGSIFGNLIGGLFGGGPKRGTVSFSNGSSTVTNSKTADTVSSINTVGGSVQDALTKIASALGGSVGNYGFTMGMRNDVWRVSGSPNADLQDNIGPLLYSGTDQTAALKAALANAIQDGAIAGLNAFEQKILTNGGSNIDKAVQDVVDIRGVFKSLKQYTDPVGAALDDLDTKFSHLKDVFVTNGASAEDYAKLEKLYGIERAKAIEAANQQIIGSLKNLYDNLTIGDSGLSLRDRQSNAMAKFNPLMARVQAGDTTAYDAFASAAQTVLDLQRQIGGSQDSYFTLYNQITDLLKTTIDSQTSVANASANRDSPFTSTAANDNQSVIDAIGTSNDLLGAINANLASLINAGIYGGGGSGGGQNYAVNYF